MRYKKKLILLFSLLTVVTIMQYALPDYPSLVSVYNQYIFHPFQAFRNVVLGLFPFSVGDLLYAAAGLYLAYLIGKWIYYIVTYKKNYAQLGNSVLHTLMTICVCYILFFIGWGGNYYKPSLGTFWDLDRTVQQHDTALEAYDLFLVQKLNTYASGYRPAAFNELSKQAAQYYEEYTTSDRWKHSLRAKPSLFGRFMQYFGIQGYYNPFTGEAQVNNVLPAFMQPFIICHEMAHQTGIAAEDDANLLAYAVSVKAPDPNFRYAAYLNLWLYTNARLRVLDTAKANHYRRMINPITQGHLDTLRELRRQYKTDISIYSGQLYDGYLKLHHQKEGIASYNKVALSARAWELKQEKGPIVIP